MVVVVRVVRERERERERVVKVVVRVGMSVLMKAGMKRKVIVSYPKLLTARLWVCFDR